MFFGIVDSYSCIQVDLSRFDWSGFFFKVKLLEKSRESFVVAWNFIDSLVNTSINKKYIYIYLGSRMSKFFLIIMVFTRNDQSFDQIPWWQFFWPNAPVPCIWHDFIEIIGYMMIGMLLLPASVTTRIIPCIFFVRDPINLFFSLFLRGGASQVIYDVHTLDWVCQSLGGKCQESLGCLI